jgi:hypothetical protein
MIEDPIVDEVRRNRRELSEKHGNDLRRLVEYLREQEKQSKREILNPGPRQRLDRTGS